MKRFTFFISIVAFAYFAFLFLMYFTETEFPTVAGAVHEMIMLPLMIAIPVFFIIALVNVIREKFNVRSLSFYALLLFIAAIVMMILMIKGYIELEM